MKHIKLFENFSEENKGLSPVDVSKPGEVVVVIHNDDKYSVALVKLGSQEETLLRNYIQEAESDFSQYPGIFRSNFFTEPGIAYVTLNHNGTTSPLYVGERVQTLKSPYWITPTREINTHPMNSDPNMDLYASVLVRDAVLSQTGQGNPEVMSVDEFIEESTRDF